MPPDRREHLVEALGSGERRYAILRHHADSPQLPGGYSAMFILAALYVVANLVVVISTVVAMVFIDWRLTLLAASISAAAAAVRPAHPPAR